ncbi:MAG: redoxin domain-containing protein [Patescibacteria group bacterium]
MKTSNGIFMVVIIVAILVVGGVMFAVGRNSSSPASNSQLNGPVTELADMNSLLNKPAPDFTLADKTGALLKLSDLRDKTIVLFFNEGLMCYPACWDQMAQLASDSRLNTDAIKSYSVVVDTVKNWGPAIAQMPDLAKANVLYDTDSTVSKMYGMLKGTSSMHYGIYPGHTYIVIDSSGIVRYVLDDPRMAINNDKLVEEIQNLQTPK